MKAFCFLLAICLISVQFAVGCTIAGHEISKFDDDEYIFIGIVVGYTKEVGFDEKRAKKPIEAISASFLSKTQEVPSHAVGLILKVKESVYLPKAGSEFEVFQYDLMADCSLSGQTSSYLERKFPINSEVRVITRESELLTELQNGKRRLEDRPDEQGQVIINSQKEKRLTSSESVFNYAEYSYDMNMDSDSKYLLPSFEGRKDLLRLKRAVTQIERNAILKRLSDAPSQSNIDFREVLRLYSASEAEARRTYETFLKTKNPDAYEAYQMWEKLVADLLKLGYQRSEAERAIRMAFDQGILFDSPDLLQRCIEILRGEKKTAP